MGDQVGGLNHGVGVGNGKDGTDVGNGQTKVLTTDCDKWRLERSKGLKFETWLVQKMIWFLREKGKIRTVTVLWG